jgi:hypothetical protein
MRDDRWFVEVLTPFGTWTPVVFHGEKPTQRAMDKTSCRFRYDPILVPPEMNDLSVDVIYAVLSPEGKMRHIPLEQLVPFLKYPGSATLRYVVGKE